MERWQRAHPDWPADLPVALSAPGPKGQVIHDANRAAAQGGVRRGALVTACTALCPGLRIDEARPAEDAAALARLVHWARRWGPLSAPDGAAGMVIDTTGVAHLFGGEAAMLADIQGRFASAGLTARVAVAPGWGAAWALARFGPERAICHDLADLDPLPVEALRLSAETCLLLGRLGLKTVAALAAIPRLSLMRRFNRAPREDNPLIRLDQLRGALAEPVGAPEPPPLFQAVARLAEPVMDPRDWLPGLTAEVCAAMAARDQGCRRLRLSVFRVDGERRDVVARCAAPSREAAHLLRLWGDRLDRLDPGYGFDLITLTALATEPLEPAQPRLDAEGQDHALELARLVDRLTARFGPGPISCPVPRESHIPERAEGPGGVLEVGGGAGEGKGRKAGSVALAPRGGDGAPRLVAQNGRVGEAQAVTGGGVEKAPSDTAQETRGRAKREEGCEVLRDLPSPTIMRGGQAEAGLGQGPTALGGIGAALRVVPSGAPPVSSDTTRETAGQAKGEEGCEPIRDGASQAMVRGGQAEVRIERGSAAPEGVGVAQPVVPGGAQKVSSGNLSDAEKDSREEASEGLAGGALGEARLAQGSTAQGVNAGAVQPSPAQAQQVSSDAARQAEGRGKGKEGCEAIRSFPFQVMARGGNAEVRLAQGPTAQGVTVGVVRPFPGKAQHVSSGVARQAESRAKGEEGWGAIRSFPFQVIGRDGQAEVRLVQGPAAQGVTVGVVQPFPGKAQKVSSDTAPEAESPAKGEEASEAFRDGSSPMIVGSGNTDVRVVHASDARSERFSGSSPARPSVLRSVPRPKVEPDAAPSPACKNTTCQTGPRQASSPDAVSHAPRVDPCPASRAEGNPSPGPRLSAGRSPDPAADPASPLRSVTRAPAPPRPAQPPARPAPTLAAVAPPLIPAAASPPLPAAPPLSPRPIRLFDPPEEIRVLYAVPDGPPAQFVWRRQTLRAARFAGPERIAPEWWRDRPGVRLRDYFRIEDEHGRRLWIFREGMPGDGRGGAPRWFLHGVFA